MCSKLIFQSGTWEVLLYKFLCNLEDVAVEGGVRLVLEPGDRLRHLLTAPLQGHREPTHGRERVVYYSTQRYHFNSISAEAGSQSNPVYDTYFNFKLYVYIIQWKNCTSVWNWFRIKKKQKKKTNFFFCILYT